MGEKGACALYKNKSPATPSFRERTYARLVFCLLASSRWAAGGNTLWASKYRSEASGLRLVLHPSRKPRGERPTDLRAEISLWNEQSLRAEEKARAVQW
jgi:hypothetical protein